MDPELATGILGHIALTVAYPSSSQKHRPPKFHVYPGLLYIRLDSETLLLSRLHNKQSFSSPKNQNSKSHYRKSLLKILGPSTQHSVLFHRDYRVDGAAPATLSKTHYRASTVFQEGAQRVW